MTINTGTTILDKIVKQKLNEIAEAKSRVSVSKLEQQKAFQRECYSLKDFMLSPERTGIIAEFKRVSPSKGIINDKVSVTEVTQGYASAGASALSVLTDSNFFGGSVDDLLKARAANVIPVLRKEFILDEYQIIEAKAIGADIILLIAAILSPKQVQSFSDIAKDLGLNVLLEVHNKEELDHSLCDGLDAVGVNNRNLADFSVSLQHSYDLVDLIPEKFLKVSESGISNPKTIHELKQAGFNGFLIGENFMKEENPGKAMEAFVEEIKKIK
jgi:indole-3-glycerol phosphate synthase